MKKKPAKDKSAAQARRAVQPQSKRGRGAKGKTSAKSKVALETLLVPIDFSAASLYPIQWAKFIARLTNATIHFVHVHEFGYPVAPALMPPVIGSEAEIKDRLHRHLQAITQHEKVAKAAIHIRVGGAFEQICELASEIQADLIALSTHGRTGWKRVLLGSTAERILRHAPCPVLVARRRNRGKTKVKIGKVVVPVDFSHCAAQGVEYAIGLAQIFGAKLTLLNVVQLHHDMPPMVIFTESKLKRWAREVAESHMADLLRATDFGVVKVESVIRLGSPARKIRRYAQQIGADLIVTSTHGRTGLPHVLMGSVAEQVVRYAGCAVLVVPTRDRS